MLEITLFVVYSVTFGMLCTWLGFTLRRDIEELEEEDDDEEEKEALRAQLRRVARLRTDCARRLMAERSWTKEQKERHRRDLMEIDAILADALPAYIHEMTDIRNRGLE